MAGRIADLMVTISGDSSGLRKELNAVKRQIQSAFGSESLRLSEQIASKFKWVAAGAVALGAAAVKMSAEMDMVTRAFEVLTGSADRAKEHVEQLERFAATTPFEFPGLLEASKKLQAYGFQAEAVIPIMQTVGDAAMAVGLGQEGINRITLALGQMNAKGKVSAEEMRQLAETGLPAWDMLAQGIGVSVPQAMELAKKGAIDATAGIGALLTGLDSKFNGMMDKMAGEIPQSFSNMQDSVKSIMRTLGADLTETFDLKTKMKGAADWLGEFASLAKTSGIREALEQMVPASLQTAIVGISAAIVGIAVPAFALLAINVIAATWPLLAIAGVVAVAAMAIYNNWGGMGMFWSVLWKGIVSIVTWAWDAISYVCGKIASLVSWITDKVSSFMDVVRRVKTFALTGVMPEVEVKGEVKVETKEVDTAKKKVWSLKDAIDSLKPVGAAGGTQKVGGGKTAKSAIDKEAQAYDRLKEKAKSVSDRIEDEYLQATDDKIGILNKWKNKELAELDASARANKNYQEDKARLEQVYEIKKNKILEEQARDRKKALDDQAREEEKVLEKIKDKYAQITAFSRRGKTKDLFDVEDKAERDIKSAKAFFDEITADYAKATDEQKEKIINTLKESEIAYKKTNEGKLNLDEAFNKYALERNNQLQDEKLRYYRKCKDIEADIQEAYDESSLARLRETLNKENLMRLENFNAQKRIMDLYQTVTIAAHVTTAEQVASLLDSSRGMFKTFFSSILTGAKDFGEAFKELMSNLLSNIVDLLAEKLSNKLVEGLFGVAFGGENGGGIFGSLFGEPAAIQQQMAQETALSSLKIANISAETAAFTAGEAAKSAATIAGNEAIAAASTASLAAQTAASATAAAAVASAWAPAAAAVSLASFGSNSAAAMAGITATHALSQTLAKGVVPGLASGGYISGPGSGTSDSILAKLSNGEYVMKAEAVRRLGVSFLDKLNHGTLRGFASGGYVIPEFQAGPGRIDSAALSIPAKLIKALTGTDSRQDKEQPGGVVNIYGDINNSADEKRLLNRMNSTMRAALMGGY